MPSLDDQKIQAFDDLHANSLPITSSIVCSDVEEAWPFP
jgi:hypothetical protein